MSRNAHVREIISLCLAAALCLGALALPLERMADAGAPLTPAGKAVIGIFLLAVTLWISEAIPFAATSLLVLLLMPLLGATAPGGTPGGAGGEAYSVADGFARVLEVGFGSPVLMFTVGLMFLSAAVAKTGLGERLVGAAMRRARLSRAGVVLVYMVLGAFIGMWFSATVGAVIMVGTLPGLFGALAAPEGGEPAQAGSGRERNFRIAVTIASAWGPLIGGMATPAGALSNMIAIEYFGKLLGREITFGQWFLFGVPVALLLIPAAWAILIACFPQGPGPARTGAGVGAGGEVPGAARGRRGRFTPEQVKVMGVCSLTFAVWTLLPAINAATGLGLTIHWVALAGGVAIFLPGLRVMAWNEAVREVDWSTIVLLASGISLGFFASTTGAAAWIASVLLQHVAALAGLAAVAAVVLVVVVLKFFLNSTTITGAVLIPIVLEFALEHGVAPLQFGIPAALACSAGFALVTQSVAGVVAYGTGNIGLRDMLRPGLVLSAVAVVVIAGWTYAARGLWL